MSSLLATAPESCCTVGVKHEGVPTGKTIHLANKIEAYISEPTGEKKKGALLYIPDVLGIWINSKLMVDAFAANGYYTIMPDVFLGDPLALNRPPSFDFQKWLSNGSSGNNPHTPEAVNPIILTALEHIKSQGYEQIGALGYCFGAKYVLQHFHSGVKVGFVAHPSFCTEDEFAGRTGPLSIAAAETDPIFPTDKRHATEAILQKNGQPYQIYLYGQVSHGFAVRCDPSVKVEKFAKEQAFIQAVNFFDAFLV